MIDILLCSLVVSLFSLGFKISTGDGMILNWLKRGLDEVFIIREGKYSKWYYPILYCIKCMPSIYGTGLCLLLLPFHVELIYQIPLVIFCSVTLNSIFYQLYD